MDGQDSQDPKQSTADMTAFVQNLLQQMQNRFQTMSDSIVTKRWAGLPILYDGYCRLVLYSNCGSTVFLDFNALDDMGNRINELEQSINELREEIGVEGTSSPAAPSKPKEEELIKEEGSA